MRDRGGENDSQPFKLLGQQKEAKAVLPSRTGRKFHTCQRITNNVYEGCSTEWGKIALGAELQGRRATQWTGPWTRGEVGKDEV